MSEPIRALVVDDEPLARRGILVRLERAGGFAIAGQCGSGREAIAAIPELRPDLVFLDVQMPGIDGFGVVAAVGTDRMPPTVFVTAYDQHALAAFEAQALDYVLKPIDDDRFERTLDRARRRVEERRAGRRRSADERLVIRERGRAELIDPERVSWIEARGDYVRLHGDGQRRLLRETMTTLERRLDPGRFVRIHRSTIVNLHYVREVGLRTGRDWSVVLADGTRLRLSRRYRARLEERLVRA